MAIDRIGAVNRQLVDDIMVFSHALYVCQGQEPDAKVSRSVPARH